MAVITNLEEFRRKQMTGADLVNAPRPSFEPNYGQPKPASFESRARLSDPSGAQFIDDRKAGIDERRAAADKAVAQHPGIQGMGRDTAALRHRMDLVGRNIAGEPTLIKNQFGNLMENDPGFNASVRKGLDISLNRGQRTKTDLGNHRELTGRAGVVLRDLRRRQQAGEDVSYELRNLRNQVGNLAGQIQVPGGTPTEAQQGAAQDLGNRLGNIGTSIGELQRFTPTAMLERQTQQRNLDRQTQRLAAMAEIRSKQGRPPTGREVFSEVQDSIRNGTFRPLDQNSDTFDADLKERAEEIGGFLDEFYPDLPPSTRKQMIERGLTMILNAGTGE